MNKSEVGVNQVAEQGYRGAGGTRGQGDRKDVFEIILQVWF